MGTDIPLEGVLAIQLLIARAANQDSLNWWDDNALSTEAEFVLDRIFPSLPAAVGRRLALEAARQRHDAAVSEPGRFLHLYHLDHKNADRLMLRFASVDAVVPPREPIPTQEALRVHLLEITERPCPSHVLRTGPGRTVEIEMPPCPPRMHPFVHRAHTLAWAYLDSSPGMLQIPYFREDQGAGH